MKPTSLLVVMPAMLFSGCISGRSCQPDDHTDVSHTVRIEINDPQAKDMTYRTCQFAIFRTLSPEVRITLDPAISPGPGEFQVLIDDGDDGTDDSMDISSLFTFSGGEANAIVPQTVHAGALPGPNQHEFRASVDYPQRIHVVYFGENRIRLLVDGEERFSAWMMFFDDEYNYVLGRNYGGEQIPGAPEGVQMMTYHIMLFFQEEDTDATISAFLLNQRLRPQGFAEPYNLLQARAVESLRGQALLDRIDQLNEAEGREIAGTDVMTSDPDLFQPPGPG